MKHLIMLLLLTQLIGCSQLADYLLKNDSGTSLDTQVGDTDNKVKTGVGSVGNRIDSTASVDGNSNVVVSTTGKFHFKSDKNLTVKVYENTSGK